jgi:hypothetical protein
MPARVNVTVTYQERCVPTFGGVRDFQVSLKIFKVVLRNDFLGFHVIHHFQESDTRLTGSTCQGERAAAIETAK